MMSPKTHKEEWLKSKELTKWDILSSSGKFPDRPAKYPPGPSTVANAIDLSERLNRLMLYWERPIILTSGYRPAAINSQVKGAALKSHHIVCAAADISDEDGALDAFCMSDLPMLEHLGLWLEHPDSTPGWCHLQLLPPRSGNRVFKP